MGIDFLVIDESHFFKNLPYTTQLRGVKGLGTPSGSARAKDLLWKTKFFQDIPNAKVLFLSGTPITNSIVEVYGLMQYLAPDLLKSLNINGLDDFIKDFAVAKEGFEMNLDAKTFKRTERLSEFTNLHALRSILSTFTHTVSLEDLKEQNKGIVPEIECQEHFVPRSLVQKEAYEALGERINRLQMGMRKEDNHLLILHDARSIAADVRLKDLNAKVGENETKNAYIAERIFRSYLKNNELKGTQLVYYAINSPKAKSYNVDPTFEGQKRDIDTLIEKRKQEALKREAMDQEIRIQEKIQEAVRAGKSKEEIDKIVQDATSVVIDNDSSSKEQKSDDEIYAVSLDNSDSIAQRGHSGFCVASNLLRHLVSRGIPQNEIAFVNDFTTIEAKVQMQQMVNKGEKNRQRSV
ncbi:SNF2-related protein [Helicobacter pylori]